MMFPSAKAKRKENSSDEVKEVKVVNTESSDPTLQQLSNFDSMDEKGKENEAYQNRPTTLL